VDPDELNILIAEQENKRIGLRIAAWIARVIGAIALMSVAGGHRSGGTYLLGLTIFAFTLCWAVWAGLRSRPDYYNDPENDYGTIRSLRRHQNAMKALEEMHNDYHNRRGWC